MPFASHRHRNDGPVVWRFPTTQATASDDREFLAQSASRRANLH